MAPPGFSPRAPPETFGGSAAFRSLNRSRKTGKTGTLIGSQVVNCSSRREVHRSPGLQASMPEDARPLALRVHCVSTLVRPVPKQAMQRDPLKPRTW